jgi:hypothetical protein
MDMCSYDFGATRLFTKETAAKPQEMPNAGVMVMLNGEPAA